MMHADGILTLHDKINLPDPDRDRLALGIKGLAPYYFDIDAAVFLGKKHLYGQSADYARKEGEDTDDFRFVSGIRFWF
jgi:uncharacterized protein involved in copper resistance